MKLGLTKQFIEQRRQLFMEPHFVYFLAYRLKKNQVDVIDGPLIQNPIKKNLFIRTVLELEKVWLKIFLEIHRHIVQKRLESLQTDWGSSCNFCILLTFMRSATRKMNDSTKIWRPWRKGIKVDGM